MILRSVRMNIMPSESDRARPAIVWQALWSLAALLVFVPLALWGVSLDAAVRLLAAADWRPVLAAALLFALTTLARAWRWRYFFAALPPLPDSFAAIAIGQTVNFMLPARLGDVARVLVLRRRAGEPAARVAGTLIAEKIADLSMLAAAGLACAPFMSVPEWLVEPGLRGAALAALLVLLAVAAYARRQRLRGLAVWLSQRIAPAKAESIGRQVDLAAGGFDALARRELFTAILPQSVLILLLMIATNWVLFAALPAAGMPLLPATFLLVVMQIGVALPGTPGRLGVFQVLVNVTLAWFGFDRDMAFSYGLLLYLVVALSQVVLAAPFLWQEAAARGRAGTT